MSLQKNFPRERKYYFWAIFLCYLVSDDAASSDVDRKLFGTLAYRFAQKAVSEVPSNPVCDYSLHAHWIYGLDVMTDWALFKWLTTDRIIKPSESHTNRRGTSLGYSNSRNAGSFRRDCAAP